MSPLSRAVACLRMNYSTDVHLLREDCENLTALLKRIETLIQLADAHGKDEVVHYLTLAQAELRRIIAIEGGVSVN